MQFISEYHRISRRIMRISQAVIEESLSAREKKLKTILNNYLPSDETSEYAYIFLLCYGKFNSQKARGVDKMAAALNLLQASTFIIDDVLDESSIRYDEATIWSEYGTGMGITCGRLMESIAVEALIAETQRRFPSQLGFVTETINNIVKDVYLGQTLDLTASTPSFASYKRMIELTTGNFFKYIARLGGGLGKLNSREINVIEECSYCYGMALQITDDVLDVEASTILTGKDFAADLKNRRLRLPMILALKMTTNRDFEKLTDFLNKKGNSDLNLIVAIVTKCGAIEKCVAIARRYIQRGQKLLTCLAKTTTRHSLEQLLDDLLHKQLLE